MLYSIEIKHKTIIRVRFGKIGIEVLIIKEEYVKLKSAAENCQLEVVRFFITIRYDKESRNQTGYTPLIL